HSIDLNPATASGTNHTLVLENHVFDPSSAIANPLNTLVFATPQTFQTGDQVTYHNGGGTSVGAVFAMTGAPGLTFTSAGTSPLASIARSTGSWTTDGFMAGDTITVNGVEAVSSGSSNAGTYVVDSVSSDGSTLYLASGSTLYSQTVNTQSFTGVSVTRQGQ